MSEIHLLQSPENGIVLAHGHDEYTHNLLQEYLGDGALGAFLAEFENNYTVVAFPDEQYDTLVYVLTEGELLKVVEGTDCGGCY